MISGYVPGTSWLHRLGPGATYLLILVPSVFALSLRTWWAAVALVLLAVALLLSTRIPPRVSLWMPTGLWVLLAVLAAAQLVSRDWRGALMVVGNFYGCVAMSRVLTLTTPISDLMDALVRVTRPLRRLGFHPERFALAVALTVRSVPWLLDSVTTVRQAARARGLERRWFGYLTPVVIGAVAHAQASGEALAARGLGDEPD